MFVLPANENMGKGGSGGHASNQPPAVIESPVVYKFSPITNADRIRAMTDEELAELFANDNCGYCRIHDFCFAKGCAINCEDVWLDWLKQEARDG